jgi:hypothetical protein
MWLKMKRRALAKSRGHVEIYITRVHALSSVMSTVIQENDVTVVDKPELRQAEHS